MTSPTIHVVAALVIDERGFALMVRKRGTSVFMQPGGKPEPGEELLDALRRELHEELGLTEPAERYAWIGTFEEDAANEPGHRVRADVWSLGLSGVEPVGAAEIAEARWVDPADVGDIEVAPLSSRALLPLVGRSEID